MKKKIALFAFNGEPMCFVHVLLNAKEMHEKGYEVKIIMEGSATSLIKTLNKPDAVFGKLYKEVRDLGLIDCTCKACTAKMGATAEAEEQKIVLDGEIMGHPSISRFIEDGYEIISF